MGRAARRFLVVLVALVSGLALAQPPAVDVELSSPGAVPLGGTSTLVASFDGRDATGYGPFIDLIVPVTGMDGDDGVDDGVSVTGARYLGSNVAYTVVDFEDDGTGSAVAEHPLLVDDTGQPVMVPAPAGYGVGDALVVIEPPFGSVTPGQPPIDVEVDLELSNLADLTPSLEIQGRGGFFLGGNALDNPDDDPQVVQEIEQAATSLVEPRVLTASKSYSGPENETAIGKNFPRQYRLTVDIPDGQTVADLVLTDVLPGNLAFLAVDDDGGGSVELAPLAHEKGGTLEVAFGSLTGDPGVDAEVTFSFYVPLTDADGVPSGDQGNKKQATNTLAVDGTWEPFDTRDATEQLSAADDHVLQLVNNEGEDVQPVNGLLTVQKRASLDTDQGATGPTPGDRVEYVVDIQISDDSAFDELVVTDDLGDGLAFVDDPSPEVTLNTGAGAGGTITIAASETSNVDDGTTTLTFDVSTALDDADIDGAEDGRVLGGCVPPSGGTVDCNAYDAGPTTLTLTFLADIMETYRKAPASDETTVVQGDVLTNDVAARGEILDPSDLTTTRQTDDDTSSASVRVPTPTLGKALYAIDGVLAPEPPEFAPGSSVTYRLTLDLPTSDFEDLEIRDYFPLPVFDVDSLPGSLDFVTDAGAVPTAGAWAYGPTHDFSSDPTVSVHAATNSVAFDFDSNNDAGSNPSTIDLLITLRTEDAAFSDRLLLTNLGSARASTSDSTTQNLASDAIVQVVYTRPELNVSKGVVAVTNSQLDSQPTFPFPSTSITSTTNRDAFDQDLSGVDAGDVITFAIIVENTGSGVGGARDVIVADDLPAGLTIGDASNLKVRAGNDTPLATSDTLSDLFGAGLEIDDVLAPGVVDGAPTSDGSNIAVITYRVTLPDTVTPSTDYANTSTIESFAGREDGTNLAPALRPSDDATVTTDEPSISKSVVATSEAHTSGSDVTIGEIVRYEVDVVVPEGTTEGLVIEDQLPDGLTAVDVPDTVKVTTRNGLGGVTVSSDDITYDAGAHQLRINVGDVVNSDNDADDEILTVEFNALVENVASNQDTDVLQNSVTAETSTTSSGPAQESVTVREPLPTVDKSVVGAATGDANDTPTFEIVVTGGNTAAFDLQLTDIVPTPLTVTNVSITTTTIDNAPNITDNSSGNTIDLTIDRLDPGEKVTVTVDTTVQIGAEPSEQIVNTANLTFTSLPGEGTADNGTGSQAGDPGTAGGERTGSGTSPNPPNDYTRSGTATFDVRSPQAAKLLIDTSESRTQGSDVAIGEVVRYELEVVVPEGTSSNLTVRDDLPLGLAPINLDSTLTIDTTNFDDTATFGSPSPTAQESDDTPKPGRTRLEFDFGEVVNNDSDPDDETILIEFDVLVLNVAPDTSGTTFAAGATFANRFDVLVGGTVRATSASEDVTLVEPDLTLSSDVVSTDGVGTIDASGDLSGADARDEAVLDFVIANDGDADAFELVLDETLPAGLELVSVTTANVPAYVTADTSSSSTATGTVSVSIDELHVGDDVTVKIRVRLTGDATPGDIITTTPSVRYTGLLGNGSRTPGASGDDDGERNGSDGDLGNEDPNDYVANGISQITVRNLAIRKSIVGTSEPSTQAGTDATDATIGEIVRYRLEVDVPEGETPGLTVVDDLPDGLTAVDNLEGSAAVTPEGFQNTPTFGVSANPIPTTSNDGATITFDFGVVTNADDDAGTETLRIEFDVLVARPAEDGDTLDNEAAVRSDGSDAATAEPVTVDVVEPDLGTPVKSLVTAPTDAGDAVQYELTFKNTGTATAFDVAVTDPLDPLLERADAALPAAAVTSTVSPAPTITTDDSDATKVNLVLDAIDPDETVTVTIDATVIATAPAGGSIANQAKVAYDSLPGTGTSMSDGDNETFSEASDGDQASYGPTYSNEVTTSLAEPTVSKSVDPATAPVGAPVAFTVTVTLPEGITRDLVLSDTLPTGLGYLSHSVDAGAFGGTLPTPSETVPGSSDSGGTFSLDFGDVTATANDDATDDTFDVVVTARVLDETGVTRGSELTNDVSLSFTDPESDGGTPEATATLTIEEPELTVTKEIVAVTGNGTASDGDASSLDVGDEVEYLVTIAHTSDSDATAYDLAVTDDVPAGLTLATPTASDVTAPSGATVDLARSDADTVGVDVSDLPEGETVTITYRATLDAGSTASATITNTAGLGYQSLADDDEPEQRSYATDDSASATTADPTLGVAKRLVDGPMPAPNADGTYDLEFVFTLENLGDVSLADVGLTEDLDATFGPAGPSWEITSLTATGSLTEAGGVVGATTGDGAQQLLDAASSTLAIGASATVTLGVLVTPDAPTDLANYDNAATGSATSEGGIDAPDDVSTDGNDPDPDGDGDGDPTEQDPTPVVLADDENLSLSKAAPATFDFGDGAEDNPRNNGDGTYDLAYTLTLTNTGDVDLTNVQITDDLSATFDDAANTSILDLDSSTLGVNDTYDGDTDQGLLAPNQALDVGQTTTITLTLRITPAADLGPYDNDASATGTTPSGGTADDTATAPSTTFDESPAIGIAKAVPTSFDFGGGAEDNPHNNGDGTYDLAYTLTLTNTGDVDLTNVQITDDLSATFDDAAGYTVLGLASPDLDVNDGTNGYDGDTDQGLLAPNQTLDVGQTATITLTLRITPAADLGPYDNQASAEGTSPANVQVTDDSVAGTDPDASGNGDPGDDAGPTPVTFAEAPALTLAKNAPDTFAFGGGAAEPNPRNNGDGTYDLAYTLALENTGDVSLAGVQANDDLTGTFADATSFTVLSLASPDLDVNGAYDGDSDTGLLAPNQSLDVGDTATLTLTVRITPAADLGPYQNQATAEGTSPADIQVTDDGDAETTFREDPRIGVAKRFVELAAVDGSPGVFDVTFAFVLGNYGDVPLQDVGLEDDLATSLQNSAYTIQALTADGGLVPNAALVGQSDPAGTLQLLDTTQSALPGPTGGAVPTGTVTLTLRVTPDDPSADYENTAVASGEGPGETPTDDDSVAGEDPDPDENGDPGDDASPTPFTFESPALGLAKRVAAAENLGDGRYRIELRFTLVNFGDVPLSDLSIQDDLQGQYAAVEAIEEVRGVDGDLTTTGDAYDGAAGSELLAPGQTLPVGASYEAAVEVVVRPGTALADGELLLENRADAGGTSPGGQRVEDASNDGSDPDQGDPDGGDASLNGDGDPTNNAGPTPVTLREAPALTLSKTVPERYAFDGGTGANPRNNGDGSYDLAYRLDVENTGDVELRDLRIDDDLATAFAAADAVEVLRVEASGLDPNAGYDGVSTTNLVADGQTLAAGASATVDLVLRVTPGRDLGPYVNDAQASGTSPAGTGTEDDATGPAVTFTENPVLGVAKRVPATFDFGDGPTANPSNERDGRYTLAYRFVLENLGDVDLDAVGLRDDLETTFGEDKARVLEVRADAPLVAAESYDGAQRVGLLASSSTLAVGERATVTLIVEVTPGSDLGPYENRADATGRSPADQPVRDDSVDGADPDPDGDGDPDERGPTEVTFPESPVLGVAKDASVRRVADGSYRATFTLTLENLGDIDLRDLSIQDDLRVFYERAGLGADRIRVESDDLDVSPDFDGRDRDELLAPGQTLPFEARATITIVLEGLRPSEGTSTLENLAFASGRAPSGAPTDDASAPGLDPDPDGDGDPGGPGEDEPTDVPFDDELALLLEKRAGEGPFQVGERVPYTVWISNPGDEAIVFDLVDTPPERTAWVEGSAHLTPEPGGEARPDRSPIDGREVLVWRDLRLRPGGSLEVGYELRVLPGAEGEMRNLAVAYGGSEGGGPVTSNEAAVVVTIDQGVFDRERTLLLGRVYLDVNGDGAYDPDIDAPLPDARVLLASGVQTTTDVEGRYAFREVERGVWAVRLDRRTAPFAPAPHPEAVGDGFLHRVRVEGVTVSDFPLVPRAGLADTVRTTRLSQGPITVDKRHVPIEEGIRVVLEVRVASPTGDVVLVDPRPGDGRSSRFEIPAGTDTVTFHYDLPPESPMTDPYLEWSER
ncbi:MAG: isopeptide-forming domain-containing fimbrial protein [Trueperaceae bacterium]|nr:isopeptide-forming domain-containing fimbrial protein [Trueperaceae bacterium]